MPDLLSWAAKITHLSGMSISSYNFLGRICFQNNLPVADFYYPI